MDRMVRAALVFALILLVFPVTARADDEARVTGTCGAGASSELRLSADDGSIRVRFELDSRHAGERWRIVLVHERRVVWRGSRRTRSSTRLRLRRSIANYAGADYVRVRASGPHGNTCSAGATLMAG